MTDAEPFIPDGWHLYVPPPPPPPDTMTWRISQASFGFEERYNMGKTLCLLLYGERIDYPSDHPYLAVGCGMGWNHDDSRRKAVHPELHAFSVASPIGRFIARALEIGMGLVFAERAARQTEARAWDHIQMDLQREEITLIGGPPRTVTQFLPVSFLVLKEAHP